MRRLFLPFLAIVAILAVRVPVRAEDLVLGRFREYLDALRTQAAIPGLAATIVGNNDILWEGAFGKQDVERSIATRPDTPFHIDGLAQTFTASLILLCVEEGGLTLDEPIGQFVSRAPEPNATVRQLLSHVAADGTFKYRPERLDPLAYAIAGCHGETFREKLAKGLDRLAMIESVPGPDVVQLAPPPADVFSAPVLQRYAAVLDRLATPYVVDSRGRACRVRRRARAASCRNAAD